MKVPAENASAEKVPAGKVPAENAAVFEDQRSQIRPTEKGSEKGSANGLK